MQYVSSIGHDGRAIVVTIGWNLGHDTAKSPVTMTWSMQYWVNQGKPPQVTDEASVGIDNPAMWSTFGRLFTIWTSINCIDLPRIKMQLLKYCVFAGMIAYSCLTSALAYSEDYQIKVDVVQHPGGHLKFLHPWPGQTPPPLAAGRGDFIRSNRAWQPESVTESVTG